MKRILLISPMPPLIGGVSISSGRLYENLLDDGYDVDCYNIRPTWRFWNNSFGIILRYLLIPFWILFHKKYDIIHCHVSGIFRKVYISICKTVFFRQSKLIYTIHGDVINILESNICLWALAKSDKIICVQKGDSNRFPQNIKTKCIDIPAFILPKNISEDEIPSYIKSYIGRDSVSPLILFYGGVVLTDQYYDLYGIKDVLFLFEKLFENNTNIKLLMLVESSDDIAGKNFMNDVRNIVKKYNNNILLVENEHIPMLPLYKYCSVYVRPTKTDGDSLAVREALSLNCPVVASNNAVRPSGVSVYQNIDEMINLVNSKLTGTIDNSVKNIDNNFYDQIVSVYESL